MMRVGWVLGILLVSGCVSDGGNVRDDLFQVQKRLLSVEQQLTEGGEKARSDGVATGKRVAAMAVELTELRQDLQGLRGDLDMLKMAVVAGKLPGMSPEEDSVARRLEVAADRLTRVEETQAEVLKLLTKANKKKATKRRSRRPMTNLKQIRTAFKERRYKHIATDGPRILKRLKGKSYWEAKYLFSESLFKLGKISEAALSFNEILKDGGKHDELARVQMRMGDCFRHLGDAKAAAVYYKELIQKYPGSPDIAKAKEHVAKIEGKGA